MSSQLLSDAGEMLANRYFAGAKNGLVIDVFMPRTVANHAAGMSVHEEASPTLSSTLGEWLSNMTAKGYSVRYFTCGLNLSENW